ncbi:MAG: lipopolysaccharide biosynthesis protein [Acinetobacter sp.]
MIRNRFIKNLFGYTLVSLVGFALGLIATPLMTRLYLPDELGAISLFQSNFALIGVVVLAGQDQAFSRFFHEVEDKKTLLSVNLTIMSAAWLTSMVAVTVFARQLSFVAFGTTDTFAVVMCATCSLPFVIVRMSIQLHRMKNRIRGYTVQSVLLNVFTKIGVIGIAFIKPTAKLWIIGYVIIYSALSIVYSVVQFRKYGVKLTFVHNKDEYLSQLRFGLPVLLSAFAYILISWFPKTILNNLSGKAEVGIYASAITIASAINLIESGFNSYFGVYFYENYRNDNGEIDIIHHMLTYISIIGVSVMTILSPIIIKLLGSNYYNAINVFPFIMCAHIFASVSETTVHGIDISNRTYLHIINSLVAVTVGIVVALSTIPKLGAIGASIGYCASMLSFFIMRTLFGLKTVKVVHNLWITAIGFTSAIVISLLGTNLIQNENKLNLQVTVLAITTTIYISYFIRQKDKIRAIIKT